MLNFLKRLVKRYGFARRTEPTEWEIHDFSQNASRAKWLREQVAISKNRRLEQIVQERNALKDKLAKAIRDKKARAPIYAKLRALSVEELNVVAGR